MGGIIIYTLVSVILVSLVSLVGIFSLLWKERNLHQFLLLLVSLSAGTLFGGAFLHLLPEAVKEQGFTLKISFLLLAGVMVFFLVEKFVHWHHCHYYGPDAEEHALIHQEHHPHHLALLNLLGDGMHNFLDGLIIAGSYLVSLPLGMATTIAVIVHEVPQEIGDFGVLLYSGLTKKKALFYNFLSALLAVIGAIVGLIVGSGSEAFISLILPFAAGGFLYIAGSNLIPELHKECGLKDSFWHFAALVFGIALMAVLLLMGE